MASSTFTAFVRESKASAGVFAKRYRLSFWLVLASLLLTAVVMRPSEITVIVLGANVLLLWLAVGLFWSGHTSIWLVLTSEVLSATQMAPNRISAMALVLNLGLLLGALVAARLGALASQEA